MRHFTTANVGEGPFGEIRLDRVNSECLQQPPQAYVMQ